MIYRFMTLGTFPPIRLVARSLARVNIASANLPGVFQRADLVQKTKGSCLENRAVAAEHALETC